MFHVGTTTLDGKACCDSFVRGTFITTKSTYVSECDDCSDVWFYNEENPLVTCNKCERQLNFDGGFLDLVVAISNFLEPATNLALNFSIIVNDLLTRQSTLESRLPVEFPDTEDISEMLNDYTSIERSIQKLDEFVSTTPSESCAELKKLVVKSEQIQRRLGKLRRYARVVQLLENDQTKKALDIIGEDGFLEKLQAAMDNTIVVA